MEKYKAVIIHPNNFTEEITGSEEEISKYVDEHKDYELERMNLLFYIINYPKEEILFTGTFSECLQFRDG